MPESVAKVYNSLTPEAQKEALDFMMFLLQKQEKASSCHAEAAVQEQLPSCSEHSPGTGLSWEDIDQLR